MTASKQSAADRSRQQQATAAESLAATGWTPMSASVTDGADSSRNMVP